MLREKYNPDNIFKNKNKLETETLAVVEYKESIFRKIIKSIKRFFGL